ncbi:MAG: M20 family metallopeptidase [Promethearchaeota archaeon]
MKLNKWLERDLIAILRDLVKINTENPPGTTKEIITYLIENVFDEDLGFQNEIFSYKKGGTELHDLITSIGSGEKKIILCGHFDVVPTGEVSEWKFPPFSAHIEGDLMYGRGTSDMKGGIAMFLWVMKSLMENTRFLEKYTVVFAGTADEELGMTGSYKLRKKKVMNDAILLVVGEPTSLDVGIAEKGVSWLRLTLKGKAAHSSMPEKGINSIECAARLIPRLHQCLGGKLNPILGKSSLNIGKIEGGNVINVVPARTSLYLDYRLIPEESAQDLAEKIKKIDVKPCSMEIQVLSELPALYTDPNEPIIKNLQETLETKIIGLPYATDGARLIDSARPIPFMIFGPGNPDVIHKINESIHIHDIFKGADALTRALLKTYT